IEQPDPPARQRIVVFREILVPDMAGHARRARARYAPGGKRPQQHRTGQNAEDGDGGDVDGPEVAAEVAHACLPSPVARGASSSCSRLCAATWKRGLLRPP